MEIYRITIKNRDFLSPDWFISPNILPKYHNEPIIRILEGREFQLFSKDSIHKFLSDPFVITNNSDRMGYRLQGSPLLLKNPAEILSEAVHFGTMQIPSDGNPIILMADRQTIGGYPKIAQIAAVDLPLIAQTKPDDVLRFKFIVHDEAQILYLRREQTFQLLEERSLMLKLDKKES